MSNFPGMTNGSAARVWPLCFSYVMYQHYKINPLTLQRKRKSLAEQGKEFINTIS